MKVPRKKKTSKRPVNKTVSDCTIPARAVVLFGVARSWKSTRSAEALLHALAQGAHIKVSTDSK